MVKFTKSQYFAIFLLTFIVVVGMSIYDSIISGDSLVNGFTIAIAVVLGFMSKIEEGE